MRRLPISAVVLTTVTAVLLGLPAELAAADRGSAGRDRASAARDHGSAARDAARDHANAARDAPVPPATPRGTMPMPRAMPPVPPAMPRGTVLATPAIMPMPRPMPRGTVPVPRRDVADAARENVTRDQASPARDVASAAPDHPDPDPGVFVSENGDRSYTSFGAWIEDLQRSWSSTGSQQSDGEVSVQTSVAVGNAVSKQTVTASSPSGETSINLSTTIRAIQDGRSVTQVQRAQSRPLR